MGVWIETRNVRVTLSTKAIGCFHFETPPVIIWKKRSDLRFTNFANYISFSFSEIRHCYLFEKYIITATAQVEMSVALVSEPEVQCEV